MSELPSDFYEVSDTDSENEQELIFVDHCNKDYKIRVLDLNFKRLICFSTMTGINCRYGSECTYAHSLSDQVIDVDKLDVYRMMLGLDPVADAHSKLLFLTFMCQDCLKGKCTGGYNCRNGAFHANFKICRNDFLTGNCLNKVEPVEFDPQIVEKITSQPISADILGCLNGHHLSLRGLKPYCLMMLQKKLHLASFPAQIDQIDQIDQVRIETEFKTGDNDTAIDAEIDDIFKRN